MAEEIYCKIFVDTQLPESHFAEEICNIVSGVVKLRTISSAKFEIDVNQNEDYNDSCSLISRRDFVYFRYYLDVVPTIGTSREDFIAEIGRLLKSFWERRYSAVAACDFEDELPEKGSHLNG